MSNQTYRSVGDVIIEVLKLIPDTEKELINALNVYYKKLVYKAPEDLYTKYCWNPFINILNQYIPNKIESWHFSIAVLLENKQQT